MRSMTGVFSRATASPEMRPAPTMPTMPSGSRGSEVKVWRIRSQSRAGSVTIFSTDRVVRSQT